jgi:hypothetical protein
MKLSISFDLTGKSEMLRYVLGIGPSKMRVFLKTTPTLNFIHRVHANLIECKDYKGIKSK